jgi:hypothetical protein
LAKDEEGMSMNADDEGRAQAVRRTTDTQQKRVVPRTGWLLVTGCLAALIAAMLPTAQAEAASSTITRLTTSAVAQGRDGKPYRLRLKAFKESGSDTVLPTDITLEMRRVVRRNGSLVAEQSHVWSFPAPRSALSGTWPNLRLDTGTSLGEVGRIKMRFNKSSTSSACGGKIKRASGTLTTSGVSGGELTIDTGDAFFGTLTATKFNARLFRNSGCVRRSGGESERLPRCSRDLLFTFGARMSELPPPGPRPEEEEEVEVEFAILNALRRRATNVGFAHQPNMLGNYLRFAGARFRNENFTASRNLSTGELKSGLDAGADAPRFFSGTQTFAQTGPLERGREACRLKSGARARNVIWVRGGEWSGDMLVHFDNDGKARVSNTEAVLMRVKLVR